MVVRYKIDEEVLIIEPKYIEDEFGDNWWDLECDKYSIGTVVALKKDIEYRHRKYFDLIVKVNGWEQMVPRSAVAPLRKIKEDISTWL